MNQAYIIGRMTRDELDDAIESAANEGWNPGLHDADAFYAIDSQGFFVGKLNGNTIARASALIYDEHFAFCGFFIVNKEERGKGYGMAITQARLKYIGTRNAGIDGVVEMVEKYQNIGYQTAHRNIRYGGVINGTEKTSNHIKPLAEVDFNQLVLYDRKHFPAPRTDFLKIWIHQPEGAALAWLSDNEIQGYGVLRACRAGFKIGPLFANTPKIAQDLFRAFANQANGEQIYFDVPEPNIDAVKLAETHDLKPVFETSRMYLRQTPDLPLGNIFGITSFEAG